MLWQNQPTPEELAAEKAKQEQVEAKEKANEAKKKKDTFETTASDYSNTSAADSLKLLSLKNKLGAFAYASTLPSATDNVQLSKMEF